MKKKINIIIVSLSIVALLAYVLLVDGIDNIMTILTQANKWWLLCGVLAMMVDVYKRQAEYRRIVNKLRECFPDCAITTDIMVGFPGESEAERCV